MGIRMHLAVGYGLDLSAFPTLNRARLDCDVLENGELYAAWRRSVLAFAEKQGELPEKMIFHNVMKPPKELFDMIIYQEEFGDPDKLLLVPAGQKDSWHRYGNLLDIFLYEAQTDREGKMENEWLPYPGTLYPYVGLMKPGADQPLGVEKYWEPCYLDEPEHKDATPWAPWHLWFLLRTIFTLSDEDTTKVFLGLRPVIYRYWS